MSISPEARKARAKYLREWRKKNPDKVREQRARYWEKKGAAIKAEREARENAV